MSPFPMTPQQFRGIPVGPDAHLSHWNTVGTFPTQQECEAQRDATNPSAPLSVGDYLDQCVADDDPRIKGKLARRGFDAEALAPRSCRSRPMTDVELFHSRLTQWLFLPDGRTWTFQPSSAQSGPCRVLSADARANSGRREARKAPRAVSVPISARPHRAPGRSARSTRLPCRNRTQGALAVCSSRTPDGIVGRWLHPDLQSQLTALPSLKHRLCPT
jgi:hypothetical protein